MNKVIAIDRGEIALTHDYLKLLIKDAKSSLPDLVDKMVQEKIDNNSLSQELADTCADPISKLYLLYHLKLVDINLKSIDNLCQRVSHK
jgi:hypothetical protein